MLMIILLDVGIIVCLHNTIDKYMNFSLVCSSLRDLGILQSLSLKWQLAQHLLPLEFLHSISVQIDPVWV